MAEVLYMKVTNDIYELPLAVAGNVQELARMVGVKPATISTVISRAKAEGKTVQYRRVVIEDEQCSVYEGNG